MCKQASKDDWVELLKETHDRGYEQGAMAVYSFLKGWFGHDHEYSKDMIMTGLEQALENALKFIPAKAEAKDEAA